MCLLYSIALLCGLMIAVSDSRVIGSLARNRRQTNAIFSKPINLHRSQRQFADSSNTGFKGISDFSYMGEIAIPNFRKSTHSQLISKIPNSISDSGNVPLDDDSIVFFDISRERLINSTPPSTTTSRVMPRAVEPNACQLMCHRRITNEYNPRCGSDGITYYNPGKLDCAKRCGKQISKFTYASCGGSAQVI